MTPKQRSFWAKVAATVLASLIVGLVTWGFALQKKVTVMEVQIIQAQKDDGEIRDQLETIRKENNDAHQRILDLLMRRGK